MTARDVLAKLISLICLLFLILLLVDYPLLPVILAVILLGYALILWKAPAAWLLILPALLPVFNLAPWSGHFFFDEFDGLVLTTLVVRFWTLDTSGWKLFALKNIQIVLVLFGVTTCISAIIGLMPFPELDGNSFANYHSSYNSLRLLKGFAAAFCMIPLLNRDLRDVMILKRLFVPGMLVGLTGTVFFTLWERQVFSGLINFDKDFRVVASFAGMHTGGASLDAYLAMTLPFVVGCFVFWRSRLAWFSGIVLLGLGIYSLLVTFSRIDYLALVVSFLILFVGFVSMRLSVKKILVLLTFAVLLITAFSIPFLTGDFMHKRMSRIATDTNTRLAHWHGTLQMMDTGLVHSLFGMGLGTFPRTYANKSTLSEKPATYWYKKEGNNRYLSLPSGGFLYIDQRISLQPHTSYLLKLDLRSNDAKTRLAVPVCEKSLLYSFKCQWIVMKPGDTKGNWLHFEKKFDAGDVGGGAMFYQRRPVALSLLNERAGTVIDIDNIELWDESGENLVRNGDFSRNNDFWFFTSDNHLPWHIKNLWVHLLFEQGWAGLILLNLLIFISLGRLIKNVISGDLLSLIILSSLGGLLTVGLVDSLLDFPRITFLFLLLVNIGLFHSGGPQFARN